MSYTASLLIYVKDGVFLLTSLANVFRWLTISRVISPNSIAAPEADLSLQETTEIVSESLPSSVPETPVPALESSVSKKNEEDLPTYIPSQCQLTLKKLCSTNFLRELLVKWGR